MDVPGAAALITCWLVIGAAIFGAIWFNYLKRKRHYDALVKALELGKNPEEIKELFAIEKIAQPKNGKGLVKSGIVVIGIGLGLGMMALFLPSGAGPGLLASCVLITVFGLSLVAAYLLTRKKEKPE
ncbi:MAG: DUF6249 domain-containing protein [candidate division WOR-3 bacterium]|jgi:hypothetical protein